MDNQTASDLLDKIRQEKKANTALPTVQQELSRRVRANSLQDIKNTMLWSLGAGAAASGGVGILNLLRRNMSTPRKTSGPVTLTYPSKSTEEEETRKIANDFGDSYAGSPVTNKESMWFHYPGMLLGGLAAGYTGWKGVDALMNKRRNDTLDDELEQKRIQFRQAILGSDKQANDFGSISQELDDLFDQLQEKSAGIGNVIDSVAGEGATGNAVGQGLGMYATYAIPAALLAGYAAYRSGKKKNRRSVLDAAIKRRARYRAQKQPTPIYASMAPSEEEEQLS